MAAFASTMAARPVTVLRSAPRKSMAGAPLKATSNGAKVVMRDMWLPGADAPAHLDGKMAGDFGEQCMSSVLFPRTRKHASDAVFPSYVYICAREDFGVYDTRQL